jgi:hypothetical protein
MQDVLHHVERAAVEEARAQGATWSQVAEALNRTRQAVEQRFGESVDPGRRSRPTRESRSSPDRLLIVIPRALAFALLFSTQENLDRPQRFG